MEKIDVSDVNAPMKQVAGADEIDVKFEVHVNDFIKQYQPALVRLAGTRDKNDSAEFE